MSWQMAMRARLISTEAGEVVGSRIYWFTRPQGTPLPAMTYHKIGQLRYDGLVQRERLSLVRVQYDAWASSSQEAEDLSLRALRGLQHYQIVPDLMAVQLVSTQDDKEDETGTCRVIMEWDVHTREE